MEAAMALLNEVGTRLPTEKQISSASDRQIIDLAGGVAALVKRLEAVAVTCAGLLERRMRNGGAKEVGFQSADHVVREVTGTSMRRARSRVRLATAIMGDEGEPGLPLVSAAMEEGHLNEEAALKIADTLAAHSKGRKRYLPQMEADLVGAALGIASGTGATRREHVQEAIARGEGQAAHLDDVGRTCSQASKTWGAQRAVQADKSSVARRYLAVGVEKNGLVSVRGSLLPEVAATLETMVNAITSPRTRKENAASDRTPGQKRHDALATILNVAATSPRLPSAAGGPITVLVQTTKEDLENRLPGVVHTNHGAVATSALAVEHAACSGALQFFVTDPKGRIIALGSQQRIFTAHQRRAIMARDGGCIIPGCDTPAQWCEVHHVVPHARAGETHTDNGVLLCYYHHRHIEHTGWNVRMRDGVPQVRAPLWKDPERKWYYPPRRGLPRGTSREDSFASIRR